MVCRREEVQSSLPDTILMHAPGNIRALNFSLFWAPACISQCIQRCEGCMEESEGAHSSVVQGDKHKSDAAGEVNEINRRRCASG